MARRGVTPGLLSVLALLALAMAPAAGATSWSLTTVPAPMIAAGSLSAISCPQAGHCVAVGTGSDGSPFAETSRGSSWQLVSARLTGPVDAVACTSPSACVAVGASDTDGQPVAAIARFDGQTWHPEAVPLPAGTTAVSLPAVSCSGRSCMAVGAVTASGRSQLLALVSSGGAWRRVSLRTPAGPDPALTGVACTGTHACIVVGGASRTAYDGAQAYRHAVGHPYVGIWNGRRFRSELLIHGPSASLLTAIACPAAGACEAVGTSPGGPVAFRLAHGSWGALRLPGLDPKFDNRITGIACASPTACVAVGNFGGDGVVSDEVGLGLVFDGKAWKLDYRGVWDDDGATFGVGCAPHGACTAVGFAGTATSAAPLVLNFQHRSWAAQQSASPTTTAPGQLYGISCLPGSCMTVGTATGPGGTRRTLAEEFDGRTWRILPTPNPTSDDDWGLDSVACTAVNACVAVGYGPAGIVIEGWNGAQWTIDPLPAGVGGAGAQLAAVACSSTDQCTAVGDEQPQEQLLQFVLHESGSGWAVQTSADTGGGILHGVACPAANDCVAVGARAASGDETAEQPLTEIWDGNTWTVAQAPEFAGGGVLDAVACPGVGACLAVGDLEGDSPGPLSELFDGTAATSVPVTAPLSGPGGLRSISCVGPSTCEAVGSIDAGDSGTTTFGAAWDGSVWSLEAPPNQPEVDPRTGAAAPSSSYLNAVGCLDPGYCLAVGASGLPGVGGGDSPLAEIGSPGS